MAQLIVEKKINYLKIKLSKVFIFFILLTSFLASVSFAEDSLQISTPAPSEQVEKESVQVPHDKLHLDFKGAKLMSVLRVLAGLTGMNFVAGKEVADREVNLLLDGVNLENSLDAIAQGSNITYEFIPGKNIYLFRAASGVEDAPLLVTRIFKLYYIRASEIREIEAGESAGSAFANLKEEKEKIAANAPILKIVGSILSERGKVEVDIRSNSLVVTDTEDRLKLIELAIAELDRPLNQVLIQAILIETFEDLDRQLGLDWSSATDGELGTVTGGISSTRFPFNVNDFLRLSTKTSLSKSELASVAASTTTAPVLGSKDFSSLAIKLKALQATSKLKIIAKPRILVLDNHPALIKITTNAAVGAATVNQANGGLNTAATSTERTETGTSLRVTPLINSEDKITLTIEPRFVTVATSTITVGANDTGDATIRTARTTLIVNSNQTIAIGGMLSSQQTHADRKMPIMGDLPIVGKLFRSSAVTIEDRELVLFINPKIIHDPAELEVSNVPDDRLNFEDEKSEFWKVKRQNWYKQLKAEPSTHNLLLKTGENKKQEQIIPETLPLAVAQPKHPS